MKKSNCISVTVLGMISLFALSLVHAHDVYPTSHNFGDVQVGTSVSTIITATNTDLFPMEITSIVLSGSTYFSLVNPPSTPITLLPNEFVKIEVSFAPFTEGVASASLGIINGDVTSVSLAGTGVSAQPPPADIQDIINFFDASVANESLVGAGSGNSADGRLNALRNMLIEASNLISAGNYEAACDQLGAALNRCNDFVQGAAQDDLAQMISDLMNDLGC